MARYIEIEQEQEQNNKAYQVALDRYALERKYNKAKPAQFFEYIIEGKNPVGYLYRSNNAEEWKHVEDTLNTFKRNKGWNQKPEPTDKYQLAVTILRHIIKIEPDFIYYKDNINSIKGIVEVYGDRLRDIDEWNPKRTKSNTVLKEILQHLFAKYNVPAFLINGFRTHSLEAIYLYLHIGAGNSIKKFQFLPSLNISAKNLHFIQFAPDNCTFHEAFRYAQVIGFGGDHYLFRALMNSKLQHITNAPDNQAKLVNDEFWITVIKFFVEHSMFNPEKISEVIDYIYDQKYTLKRVVQPDGKFVNQIQQPNFTMKGRTPMSLLNQSDEWHRFAALNAVREKNATEWEPINIPDGHFENSDNKYNIIQLTKTKELITEGNRMHHCVGTYASACIRKTCSIFSFRVTNHKKGLYDSSEVTLEIRSRTIVQARGKYNKKPEAYHMQLITKWADANDVRIGGYI